MHWNDKAIILSITKHGETSGVVALMTPQYGLYKGYVRGLSGKKSRGVYQPGNLVDASWNGRLTEHLGNFSCELVKPYAALLMSEPEKLLALSAICSVINRTLAEREAHPDIFEYLEAFISHIEEENNWHKYYVMFEIKLLQELGFGLDLERCAATGTTENLTYVSPKSGRAVSLEAGEPYKSRLFKLPKFLTKDTKNDINAEDLKNGLAISGYFLNKYIFEPHKQKIPTARERLLEFMDLAEKRTA